MRVENTSRLNTGIRLDFIPVDAESGELPEAADNIRGPLRANTPVRPPLNLTRLSTIHKYNSQSDYTSAGTEMRNHSRSLPLPLLRQNITLYGMALAQTCNRTAQ